MPIDPKMQTITDGHGSIPTGVLNKGIHLDAPSHLLPLNAFLNIKGLIVSPKGLTKFVPFKYLGSPTLSVFTGTPLIAAFTTSLSDYNTTFFLTSAGVYSFIGDTGALVIRYWEHPYKFSNTLTISAAGTKADMTTSVTVDGTTYALSFINDLMLKKGDILNVGVTSAEIASVTATGLTFDTTDLADGTVDTCIISRALSDDSFDFMTENFDTCYCEGQLMITALRFPLSYFDSGLLKILPAASIGIDPTVGNGVYSFPTLLDPARLGTFSMRTIAQFKDWIFGGYTRDTEGKHITRIVWSNPLDSPADWSSNLNFLDLPQNNGPIIKLWTVGENLIALCEKGVYYGYLSSLPDIPVVFNALAEATEGVCGPFASCLAADGVFFVGHNNIYFLQGNKVIAIGDPILAVSLQQCAHKERIRVVLDEAKHSILIGMPVTGTVIENIWIFEYRTREWSYVKRLTDVLATTTIYSNYPWEAFASTVDWEDVTGVAWADYPAPMRTSGLIATNPANNTILIGGDYNTPASDGILDSTESDVELITSDFVLDQPDIVKDFYRLSVRINDTDFNVTERDNYIQFEVWVSTDSGEFYRNLGTLSIYAGKKEGYLNFQANGHQARFKLQSRRRDVSIYTIEQFVIDVTAQSTHQTV